MATYDDGRVQCSEEECDGEAVQFAILATTVNSHDGPAANKPIAKVSPRYSALHYSKFCVVTWPPG